VRSLRTRFVTLGACTFGLSCLLVGLPASPAAAATPVLADDKFKWFYWIGPILGLSFVLLIGAMCLGYYVRVLRPKWRGRQPS
jgi:uncharacterized BrkB/YihY/UPF0761 family membrane protein